MALMGNFVLSCLAAMVRCGNCNCRIYSAPMGTGYAWKKLERYPTYNEGTGTYYQRTLSIHQASHLHSIHPHPRFNAVHFIKLADWTHLGWNDSSGYCFAYWF